MGYKIVHQKLSLYEERIETSPSIKYLGLILDRRLRYKENTRAQTNKARAMIAKLFPLLKSKSINTKTKKLMYTTLIRPILTYGCQIWGHSPPTTIKKFETTQNKCLRLILSKPIDTRIETLQILSNIPPIKEYIHQITIKYYNNKIKYHPTLSHLSRKIISTHPYPNQFVPIQ